MVIFMACSFSETMLKLLSSTATRILPKDTTIKIAHRNYTWIVIIICLLVHGVFELQSYIMSI